MIPLTTLARPERNPNGERNHYERLRMKPTAKRWTVRLLSGMVGAAALGQPALADGWLTHPKLRPGVAPSAPCVNCAPVMPQDPTPISPMPVPKSTPEVPKVEPKIEPKVQTPEPRFEPLVSAALGESSFAVNAGSSVNMFGDQFRTGSGRSSFTVLRPGALNGTPISAIFFNATKEAGNSFKYNGASAGSFATLSAGPINTNAIPTPGLSFSQAYNPTDLTISQSQAAPTIAQINSQLLQKGSPVFQVANVLEGGKLVALAVVNAQGEILGIAPVPPPTTGTITDIEYTGFLQSTIAQQFFINVPNPAGGGVVGRSKISEDANPLPRDRFIFNYDYFNNTVLTQSGFDVNRIALGIEKTFFDMRASIEVRLPFASTLDSTSGIGTESRNIELGNLRITPRVLAYKSETFNVGVGVGVSLPTADDTRVIGFDGKDFVRIRNETIILSPYIGTLWTPNDRFFAQGWVACDFDTGGNPVYANLTGTGMQDLGRVYEGSFMQWDLQLGYWLINPQDNYCTLKALAPFVELHYGSSISNPTNVSSNGFVIGDLNGRIDELNLSTGLTSVIGQQTLVSLGAVVPLSDNDNRSFTYQLGVRVNYFFGPTAANRSRATYVP